MFLTAIVVVGAALSVGQPKVGPSTQKGDNFTIDSLKAKDAKPRKFTSPMFRVPFTARSPGQTSIAMNATFFVCDVEICERKTAQLSVPVSVRP